MVDLHGVIMMRMVIGIFLFPDYPAPQMVEAFLLRGFMPKIMVCLQLTGTLILIQLDLVSPNLAIMMRTVIWICSWLELRQIQMCPHGFMIILKVWKIQINHPMPPMD